MAGLGRRSHYRKHLTDSVLHELPEPDASDRIAKVVATRGGNMFEVIIAASTTNDTNKRQPQLAILPTKFHKLVWVKRNDFVICRTGNDDEQNNNDTRGGVRLLISHILYKDQIKNLKDKNFWPFHDDEFNTDTIAPESAIRQDSSTNEDENACNLKDGADEAPNDGIVYDDFVSGDDYLLNTNRIKAMTLQDDSSSEESSSDEE